MDIPRLNKAVALARKKIAEKKLKTLNIWVDKDKQKAYYKVYSTSSDLSEMQQARVDEIKKICSSCGLKLVVLHFIDKLGEEEITE